MSKCCVFRTLNWKDLYWTALRPKDWDCAVGASRGSAPSSKMTRVVVFMSLDYPHTSGSAQVIRPSPLLNVHLPTRVHTQATTDWRSGSLQGKTERVRLL